MRSLLAPILFDEDDWESAHQQQESVVKAAKSDRTRAKARTKRRTALLHSSGGFLNEATIGERGRQVWFGRSHSGLLICLVNDASAAVDMKQCRHQA